MRTSIEPFVSEHLDGAALLFAARHARERGSRPCLPIEYERPAMARTVVASHFEQSRVEGVAARDSGGKVAGYMLGQVMLPDPTAGAAMMWRPRSANISYAGHAADPGAACDLYREMYATLSGQWVARGIFAHYAAVSTNDADALEALQSLGFARDSVRALRPAALPVSAGRVPGINIRLATAADVDEVVRLQLEMFRYHAGPPIYMVHLPEAFTGQHAAVETFLSNTACAAFLAVKEGRAVGLVTLKPSEPHPGTPNHTIYLVEGYTGADVRGSGVGTALLAEGMAWARARRYEWCVLNYLPSNLLAARFWTRNGFEAQSYRMVRVVDERIAWARG